MVDIAGVDTAALTCLGRNRRGVVVNAHIPQHEGRGNEVTGNLVTQPAHIGWVADARLRLRVVGT